MQFREAPTVEEMAKEFAKLAEEEGGKKVETIGDNELHEFVAELMSEIPEDISWIDSRFYHQFKPGTRIWISVDTLVMPQTDAIHCVFFHLLPPGGLMYNQKGTSGVAVSCLTTDTAIWMQRYTPNQTFISYPKIDEDSLLIIEVMRVSYNTDDKDEDSFFDRQTLRKDDLIFTTVGMSVMAVTTNTGELANGYYQLPIVKDAIDFDALTTELIGDATAQDIMQTVFEKNFANQQLIPHSSLFIRLYEEAFEVDILSLT